MKGVHLTSANFAVETPEMRYGAWHDGLVRHERMPGQRTFTARLEFVCDGEGFEILRAMCEREFGYRHPRAPAGRPGLPPPAPALGTGIVDGILEEPTP
jgi:hypothetical protein